MQLKRQYTVGELTPEIIKLAPAWAFHDKEWLDVRTIKDIHSVKDDSGAQIWMWVDGVGRERYRHDTDCYPCRLHENGTIERLGE